jgi:hypothetical protein
MEEREIKNLKWYGVMKMRHVLVSSGVLLLVGGCLQMRLFAGEVAKPNRSQEQDRAALVALEKDWLRAEHDAAALERILAPDFVHPVSTGDFLTKAQHILYSTKNLPLPDLKQRFDALNVRVYEDVEIVNGIVVSSDADGREVDKTVFTDVFAYRDGTWKAINAQENKVEKNRK